jgi:hypothetical protein
MGCPDCSVRLTPQPILPKLRLIKNMHQRIPRIPILAMVLVIIFVGVQFHFCADLSVAPAPSHFCPVCSTTTSAMATQAPLLAVAPVSERLESPGSRPASLVDIPRTISPRAPPKSNRIR